MSKDIKKASMQHNGIMPQVGGCFLKPVPDTVVGTGSWVLAIWDQGATQKSPEVNPKDKLWAACQAWVKEHKVTSKDQVFTWIAEEEMFFELAETVCEIVGYHEGSGDG